MEGFILREIARERIGNIDEEIKRKSRKDHKVKDADERAIKKDGEIGPDDQELGEQALAEGPANVRPIGTPTASPYRAHDAIGAQHCPEHHYESKEYESDLFRQSKHADTACKGEGTSPLWSIHF
jgi:hypothetical protein